METVVDSAGTSTFRLSALASGLLNAQQIGDAEQLLRAAESAAGKGAHATQISDEVLAAKLVELGRLNKWQAEKLSVGETNFKLGRYKLVDSIGKGGMGHVFKAEHGMMGRVVAIKVLPKHRATPEAIDSFTREIRAQAQLDHENLVRAFDAGQDRNVHFLVTEYVPGTDLRKFVRSRGCLTPQEAATIISQAANGLQHAHSRGLIHRDVKPGNLLVTPSGHTKVSDLGLAGFFDADDDPRSKKTVGTADYLSPEQILAPRTVSPASDIYSLGCTLYYALTGKVPYPGGTSREKAVRHCEDTPLNPRIFNPQISDELLTVLGAMMEKDSAKRIQTAAEVIERLAPWATDAVATTAEDADDHGSPVIADSSMLPPLSDTESGFFDDLLSPTDEAASSQISQRTDPVASAMQETLPDLARVPTRTPNEAARRELSLVVAVLLPVVLAAGLLVISLLIKAIW